MSPIASIQQKEREARVQMFRQRCRQGIAAGLGFEDIAVKHGYRTSEVRDYINSLSDAELLAVIRGVVA